MPKRLSTAQRRFVDHIQVRARAAQPTTRTETKGNTWYSIKNLSDDETEVYIYDTIGYWGVTAQNFVDELREIRTSKIKLRINSPGGDVFDGLAIYNLLMSHSATVDVYIDGLAASAASFIAMAGDRVHVARNAMMMIHDASALAWGNAADMREMADVLDTISENIADIYSHRAGGPVSEWRDAMLAETWYTGAEAVEAGLADEVFNSRDVEDDDDDETEEDDPIARFNLDVFAFAGRHRAPAPRPIRNEAELESADAGSDTSDSDQGGPDEETQDPGEVDSGDQDVEDEIDFDDMIRQMKEALA